LLLPVAGGHLPLKGNDLAIEGTPPLDETNFLAYIAWRYGRKKEDIGTDVMAYLLTKPSAKRALRKLLGNLGWPHLPSAFEVKPRKKGEKGIPDLALFGRQTGDREVIIENKFWSGLTSHQPCAYLDQVSGSNGLVLFVVPRKRRQPIWDKVQDRCEAAQRPVDTAGHRFIGETKGQYIAVTTWEEMVDHLDKHTRENRELSVFVHQLRSLCEMAQKDEIAPLDPAVLSDDHVGKAVYDYIRLAELIAETAEGEGLIYLQKKQEKGAIGTGWSGKYGEIQGYRAWIGFDARTWATYGKSPIWIEFDDKSEIEIHLRGTFEMLKKPFIFFEDDPMLIVPILLTPKVDQDFLVEQALTQIRKIYSALEIRSPKKAKGRTK
jgi:hypothetical protein